MDKLDIIEVKLYLLDNFMSLAFVCLILMMMYIRLFYWSYIDSTENDEVSEVVEESRTNSEPPRGVYVKLISN